MRAARTFVSLLAMLAAGGLAAARAQGPAAPAPSEGPVKAILELSQQFYYAGDPFYIRVSIGNDSEQPVDNPVRTPLGKGFHLRLEGQELPRVETPVEEPERPAKLAPRHFYGAVIELSKLFPQLLEPGRYEIQWAADGIASNTILVHLLQKFDPTKDYRAVLETEHGNIVLDLFPRASPFAVKNFVDLARAGFYDGSIFHEVRPERFIVGGDPTGTGAGDAGYRYPADNSNLPTVAGTVLMKPVSPSPPANSSQFIILLRPEPTWTGQLTVLGQVVEGLDVARKISLVPSTQRSQHPFYKPLKDVVIRRVTIEEREREASPESLGPGPDGGPEQSPRGNGG